MIHHRNYLSKLLIPALFISLLVLNACKKDSPDEPNVEKEASIRPFTPHSSAYVTQLLSYTPAPGQFINTPSGSMDAAKGILKGKDGLVSLGFFGGSIVLGFDHTVLNRAGKDDLIIYNNSSVTFAEPGVVWVMQDKNNNGQPDDIWYELSGSAQNQTGYTNNYSITYIRPVTSISNVSWTDSKGNSGVVKTNMYHTQAYYPEWITADSYTLTGTLLPSTNINSSNPTFITSTPFTSGYADNTPGGDKLDIANAADEKGNKAALKGIDFIKIQTGIPFNAGWLGEMSTDVKGVADLSFAGI
ncbi:cell surface protein [Mucilaginibacter terrae]|uniref:cell surface protein n=1 Tax=Mucilaginibacter terrae TaxID=1955052 RepID=UPI0036291118